MEKRIWRLISLVVVGVMLIAACAPAATKAPEPTAQPTQAQAASDINIVHYYTGDLGMGGMKTLFTSFMAADPQYKVIDNTTGHEDFKTEILVMLAGDNPPDIFAYWAGARTQFVIDSGSLIDLDQFWKDNNLDQVINPGAKPAALYNGKVYSIPQNVHVTGFWYNKKVFETAGVTATPTTWDEFLAACEKIKASGVDPIALGSKNRWPAQYWFDYMLSYTAGIDYRNKLMAGQAAYTDPEVAKAMETWKNLLDKGYFIKDPNAYDWNEASDMVANGKAGMTLMGTWIAGYLDGLGLKPAEDYDFFAFPVITPGMTEVTHGTVDGWVIPKGSKNIPGAEALILHMLKPENQALWSKAQGALAAISAVPEGTYSAAQQHAADYLAKVQFNSGYDLSTTPPMAEGGLNMFAQFVNDPSKYKDYLQQTEDVAKEVFKK